MSTQFNAAIQSATKVEKSLLGKIGAKVSKTIEDITLVAAGTAVGDFFALWRNGKTAPVTLLVIAGVVTVAGLILSRSTRS